MDSTTLSFNLTQGLAINTRTVEIVRVTLIVIMFLCYCLFLYLMSVILYVFSTNSHLQETSRYVFFTHILVNDTLYLTGGLFLMVAVLHRIAIPVPICFIIVTLVSCTFIITPYNLAVMSLERYVAICHPLRHVVLCNRQKSKIAIVMMWAIGLSPHLADFIYLRLTADITFYSLCIICTKESLELNVTQKNIRFGILVISLSLVTLVITFTYIEVMMVARKIGTGKSSAMKAGKTVMLHTFQLLLSSMSLIPSLLQTSSLGYQTLFTITNFLLFTCLPRFLSPLIYGLRDEVLSKVIRRLHCANTKISIK